MDQDRQLSLGVLFTGKMDATFKNAVKSLENALSGLNGIVARAEAATKNAGKSTAAYSASANKARVSTDSLAHTFSKGQTASTHFANSIQRVGTAMKIIASFGFAGSIIYSVMDAFKSGVRTIVDYDQALQNIKAITGASATEMAGLGKAILDIASNTRFSIKEVSDAAVIFGQAGFTAAETTQALRSAALLAQGTLEDMAMTVDLVTSALTAFHLDASEAGRVADVMANAVNKSKLTIDKLRVAFNYVGSIAAQTNISLEETGAALMVLSNNGLRASTMATGLRRIISTLIAPTEKVKEKMSDMGISIASIDPATQGFQKALKNLVDVLKDQETNTIDSSKAFELFGIWGAAAATVLTKAFTSNEYNIALYKIQEAGTAMEMSATQAEGLGIIFSRVMTQAGLFAIRLGEGGVVTVLRLFGQAIRKLLEGLNSFIKDGLGQAIISTSIFYAGFLSLIPIILAVNRVTLALRGAYQMLAFQMEIVAAVSAMTGVQVTRLTAAFRVLWATMLRNPLMWVGLALSAVIAYIYKLSTATDKEIQSSREAQSALEERRASLTNYEASLKSLNKSNIEGGEITEEYRRTVARLLTEHKELVDKLDVSTMSYDTLTEAIKALNDELARETIQKAVENLDNLDTKLENMYSKSEKIKKFVNIMGMMHGVDYKQATQSLDEYKESSEEAKSIFRELSKEEERILALTLDVAQANKMGKEQAINLYAEYVSQSRVLSTDVEKSLAKFSKIWDLVIDKQEKSKGVYISYSQIMDAATYNIKKFQAELTKIQEQKTTAPKVSEEIALAKKIYNEKIDLITAEYMKKDSMAESSFERDRLWAKMELDLLDAKNEKDISILKSTNDEDRTLASIRDKQAEIKKFREDQAIAEASGISTLETRLKAYETLQGRIVDYEADKQKHISKSLVDLTETHRIEQDIATTKETQLSLQKKIIDAMVSQDIQVKTLKEKLNKEQIDYMKRTMDQTKLMSEEEKKAINDKINLIKSELLVAETQILEKIKEQNGFTLANGEYITFNAEAIAYLEEKYNGLANSAERTGNKLNDAFTPLTEKLVGSYLDTISDALGDIMSASENAGEAFKNMVQEMIKDTIKLIMKLLLLKALQEATGSSKGGIGGAINAYAKKGLKDYGIGGSTESRGISGGTGPAAMMPMLKGGGLPAMMGGGGGKDTYIINISATDAQSFANMLRTKPAQEMVAHTIQDKFAHNAGVRRTMKRGY